MSIYFKLSFQLNMFQIRDEKIALASSDLQKGVITPHLFLNRVAFDQNGITESLEDFRVNVTADDDNDDDSHNGYS